MPGFALDLITADADGSLWDLVSKVMGDRAMKKVREEKPLFLIASPMCTASSTWQRINDNIRCPVAVAVEKKRASARPRCCVKLSGNICDMVGILCASILRVLRHGKTRSLGS